MGFLNPENSPTVDAKNASPVDLHPPRTDQTVEKTVVLFHDESTFQAIDDQPTLSVEKGKRAIQPKSRGSGIMVLDFIDERNGYLEQIQEEYDEARKHDPTITRYARQLLGYGEGKDGYWTAEKMMKQLRNAVKIAEIKYPKADERRIVWMFDHSSCHAAMPDDIL